MSQSTHKRSFLEVYASEEEEEADVNNLQKKFEEDMDTDSTADSTDNENVAYLANCETFGLKIGF